MKPQTKQICQLLEGDRGDLQCAAALVLGHLGEAETGVVEALGQLLETGHDRRVKGYVLEALERIGDHRSLEFVLPLLAREDELQEKAVRVVAGLGNGVAKDLGRRLVEAGRSERGALQRTFARIGTVAATRLLLESLSRETGSELEDALLGLRRELSTTTPRDRATFSTNVQKALAANHKLSKESRGAALRILGYLDDPATWAVLIEAARPNGDSLVRTAALRALRTVPRPARGVDTAVSQLLDYLADPDYEHVVRPTLDILRPIELPHSQLGSLEALTKSRHADVRRFVLEKLGSFDSTAAVEILLRFVDEPDPAAREPAARALSSLPSARTTVLTKLLSETKGERAWMLARVLKPQADALEAAQVRKLGERVVRHLDHDNRLYEPLLFLLCHVSAAECRAFLLRRAMRKKRSRRFDDAARTLRLLEKHEVFDAEIQYELALALLKLSSRTEAARHEDPAIELFGGLVSEGYPLFEQLRKESVLTADELAWLGAHFVSRERAEREFGGQILHLVMRKAPRSNLAKDAKSCLAENGVT